MTLQIRCSATVMKEPAGAGPGTGAFIATLAGRQLTLPRVEQAVNDAAHFTPFHGLMLC